MLSYAVVYLSFFIVYERVFGFDFFMEPVIRTLVSSADNLITHVDTVIPNQNSIGSLLFSKVDTDTQEKFVNGLISGAASRTVKEL